MSNQQNKYSDILNLDRPPSSFPRMDRTERAAQFAPFAALQGFSDTLVEATRLTAAKPELSAEMREELDWKIQELANTPEIRPNVKITYFVPDSHKAGGHYYEHTGSLAQINCLKRQLSFVDGLTIDFHCICKID